jgi:hypothetical protein
VERIDAVLAACRGLRRRPTLGRSLVPEVLPLSLAGLHLPGDVGHPIPSPGDVAAADEPLFGARGYSEHCSKVGVDLVAVMPVRPPIASS